MQRIPIFLITDNEYLAHTASTMASILKNAHNNDYIVFYIGPENLNENNKKLHDDKKLLDLLLDEKIVAWYQDRSEIGARALGHRSFIGIPTSVKMKEKLSVTIKKREMYRPVAAIIPRDLVSEYFYQEYDSPYMTFCAKAKPVTIEKAPAIVHYDGTTRVQTFTNDDNPVL